MPSSVDCQSQIDLVLPFSLQAKTVLGPGRGVRPQPGGSRYAASEPPLPIFGPQIHGCGLVMWILICTMGWVSIIPKQECLKPLQRKHTPHHRAVGAGPAAEQSSSLELTHHLCW